MIASKDTPEFVMHDSGLWSIFIGEKVSLKRFKSKDEAIKKLKKGGVVFKLTTL